MGDPITAGVRTWARSFGRFTAIALLVGIPPLLLTWMLQTSQVLRIAGSGLVYVRDVDAYHANQLVSLGVSLLVGQLSFGAVLLGAFHDRSERPWNAAASIKEAARRFFPFVGLNVVILMSVGTGLIALIVPGLIFAAALTIAPAAFMAEGIGTPAALDRATKLSKGFRWTILWVTVATQVIVFATPAYVIGPVVASIAPSANAGLYLFVRTVVAGSIGLLIQPLGPIITMSLYFECRDRKEGPSVEIDAAIPNAG